MSYFRVLSYFSLHNQDHRHFVLDAYVFGCLHFFFNDALNRSNFS